MNNQGNFGFMGQYRAVQEWHWLLVNQFAIESTGPMKVDLTKDDQPVYVCFAFIDHDTQKTIKLDFWHQGDWGNHLTVITSQPPEDLKT